MNRISTLAALTLTVLLPTSSGATQIGAGSTCPFRSWTIYGGVSLLSTADHGAYFYVTDHKRVDADGAPNAYHPDDVNGGACPRHGRGLDCPANAGYRSNEGAGNRSWWPQVLVPDPGRPDVAYRQQRGPTAGFFVSRTSLRRTAFAGETSPASYVDAATIPYAVMPEPFLRMAQTGAMGDIGVALNLENGATTPFVFADVKGSAARLGEGSIAFWRALGWTDPNPRGGPELQGRIAYVVFPRSRHAADIGWPINLRALSDEANMRLNGLGGIDTLRRCSG